ncbi:MAG: SRPBCC family protein [Gemmatimonadaceae bacterium]|nr:SRPBCC family protein [Gemmatimonadaceae bacterium]
MLKVLLAIVVAIAAIGAVIAFLGSRLPVGHVATRSVVINAPAESVFAAVSDFAAAPSWRPDLKSVEVSADQATGRQRITEVSSSGSLTMEVVLSVPPSRLVTRIVGEGLPFGGAWAYDLQPQGNATRVTITEHGEVYNPVFRFVSRYLMGHASTLETYLTNLGKRFGQEVSPADAPAVPLP